MPSYTSSFSRKLPNDNLAKKIMLSIIVGVLMVLFLENIVRFKGLEPNVRDNSGLWSSHRGLASDLGEKAIIIVGGSRSQLGLDLDVIDNELDKVTVQLSIDGSPFLEVLENLAEDYNIRGEIWISAHLENMVPREEHSLPVKWIRHYEKNFVGLWQPKIEQRLKASLMSVSALYSSIIPPQIWPEILLGKRKLSPQYLMTFANRERDADYTKVSMPNFYVQRFMRNFGGKLGSKEYASVNKLEEAVVEAVKKEKVREVPSDLKLSRLVSALQKLSGRGVKVNLINFPKSGAVEKIDDIRYPKQNWDAVAKKISFSPLINVIDYRDYSNLDFHCPDGSHIDQSQKSEFTRELIKVLVGKNSV